MLEVPFNLKGWTTLPKQTECIAVVGRSAHVQPSWRLSMRSCTSTVSPWWVWAETKISWKTGAAGEEGASLNLLRYTYIPHLMQCPVNLPLHMHEREWWWVEGLLGCSFISLPCLLAGILGIHTWKKQSIENLQYLKGPVLWHFLTWLWLLLDAAAAWFSHDGVVLRLGSVLLSMKGTLLWLRVLHQWPLGWWSVAQPLKHSGRGCDCVCLMNDLMTPH